ncbi:hypothetical protein AGABI2DRAFT_176302 [Agaricus bisporus var. bisporus H97]|uniref:hypothetical protein n=1 Tax=Agaricus bisporus var. bisporus (strain H97 / ATCC MYA-4626 / FGSC 10389) TaxID=936046 RepID=UPI00029F6BC2|nr:hypothetical protein AGABI2DRAFT_176302 [Agaricus bisporus var. bisporus H97]EKV51979.1 hypothetical protein AGABI2DRAFT_176302 [Agaricus bisporus var. bisporus H97]
MAESYAFVEPTLRHRRTEEEAGLPSVYSEDEASYLPYKQKRRRCITLPKIFIGLTLLILTALLYLSGYTPLRLLPSERIHDTSPNRGQFTFGADAKKRDAIVEAFQHSWLAYGMNAERDAMGADEYHPISHRGSNFSIHGGVGYMVIDAIDTMYLMGLKEEYNRARLWLATEHTFDRNGNFNSFEARRFLCPQTTIRVLGGLLSIFHLTEDPLYLEKAIDLADRMLPIFNTPSGLPLSMANLGLRLAVDDPRSKGLVSTAEATTLQLEYRYLSHVTGKSVYWDKVEQVMKVLKASKQHSNLVPIYMNAETGRFQNSEIRLGSRGDSYYEYLLKQYLQTNKTEEVYRTMYDAAMQGIHDKLIVKGVKDGLTFTAELLPTVQNHLEPYMLSRKQDHLVCFLGGSLMLGASTVGAAQTQVSRPPQENELTTIGKRDWQTGSELLDTCIDTHRTETGLSPEIVYYYAPNDAGKDKLKADWYIKGARRGGNPVYDARYMLRPETLESIFLAYRLTGDRRYRQIGWKIFQSIQTYCRLDEGGYASILNVDDVESRRDDKMETFWLSETLKYLYLLFEDESVIPLDAYVFNTEAHPLPIFTPNHPLADF